MKTKTDNLKTKIEILSTLEELGIIVEEDTSNDFSLYEYLSDSLMFISFIVALEDKLGIEIPDDYLSFEYLESINGFANLLDSIPDCVF